MRVCPDPPFIPRHGSPKRYIRKPPVQGCLETLNWEGHCVNTGDTATGLRQVNQAILPMGAGLFAPRSRLGPRPQQSWPRPARALSGRGAQVESEPPGMERGCTKKRVAISCLRVLFLRVAERETEGKNLFWRWTC